MVQVARDHGITVVQDPGLAGFLQGVGVGQEIPENLYVAVSKIFAYLYSQKGNK